MGSAFRRARAVKIKRQCASMHWPVSDATDRSRDRCHRVSLAITEHSFLGPEVAAPSRAR
jgi:hypothetical protein